MTFVPNAVHCLVVISMLLACHVREVGTSQCDICDRTRCPVARHCSASELVLDVCLCCRVCGRRLGQTCRRRYGDSRGDCVAPLACSISPQPGRAVSSEQVGVCTEQKAKSCKVVTCAIGSERSDQKTKQRCPPDSRPRPAVFSANGCCRVTQGCECLPAGECQVVICPDGSSPHVFAVATGQPGFCCDELRCNDSDSNEMKEVSYAPRPTQVERVGGARCQQHADGDTWRRDVCTTCTCRNGLTFCSAEQCPVPTPCGGRGRVPPGECCPVCSGGCVTDVGDVYADGDSWQTAADSCVTCRCDGSAVYCQAAQCAVSCSRPRRLPAQCCPVCDEDDVVLERAIPPKCEKLANCSVTCDDGYQLDADGCQLCRCKESAGPCRLVCPAGLQTDAAGRPLCVCATLPPPPPPPPPPSPPHCRPLRHCRRACPHGRRLTPLGCPRCRCARCPTFRCALPCPHGYRTDDRACPVCSCRVGVTSSPPLPPGGAAVGECVSVEGRRMADGETWHDGCRRCFCHERHEMCALLVCPALGCSTPVVRVGDCCPSCPESEAKKDAPSIATRCRGNHGERYAEADTWMLDECTQCICHGGGALCEVEACPPTLCRHPLHLPHRCCPICPGGNEVLSAPRRLHRPCTAGGGRAVDSGAAWRVGACQSCACRDGEVHCFSQTCGAARCERPLFRKGQCCAVCAGAVSLEVQCEHGGGVYPEGARWEEPASCLQCGCNASVVTCGALVCDAGQSCDGVTDHCCAHCTARGQQVSLAALLAAVAPLALAVVALSVVVACLCRHRALAGRVTRTTQTAAAAETKRRPKSTNLDFQGVNPLGYEMNAVSYKCVDIDSLN